jgi:hypothetical protein
VPIGQIRATKKAPPQPSGLGDGLSDPDFGTAETDIASGDILEKAGVQPGAQPAEQEVSAFDETLAGGRINEQALARSQATPQGQQVDRAPEPPDQSGPMQPSTPQAPQRQRRQSAPGLPQEPPRDTGQPQQFQDPQRSAAPSGPFTPNPAQTGQPRVYETFEGGPSSATGSAPAPRPQQGDATRGMPQQQARSDEDPLVRTIQTLFGLIAGAITLIVQVVVLLDGLPESTAATVVVALAITMGIASIVTSFAPISMQLRSIALFAIGAIIGVTFLFGFFVTVPSTFLVVALGAFVAAMAAAFPIIARHLL